MDSIDDETVDECDKKCVLFYTNKKSNYQIQDKLQAVIMYYEKENSDKNVEIYRIAFKELFPKKIIHYNHLESRYYKQDNTVMLIHDGISVDNQNFGIGSFILRMAVQWAKKHSDAQLLSFKIQNNDDKLNLRKAFYAKFGISSKQMKKNLAEYELRSNEMNVSNLIEYDLNISANSKKYSEKNIEEAIIELSRRIKIYEHQIESFLNQNKRVEKEFESFKKKRCFPLYFVCIVSIIIAIMLLKCYFMQ